jgi:hypothetical protein
VSRLNDKVAYAWRSIETPWIEKKPISQVSPAFQLLLSKQRAKEPKAHWASGNWSHSRHHKEKNHSAEASQLRILRDDKTAV